MYLGRKQGLAYGKLAKKVDRHCYTQYEVSYPTPFCCCAAINSSKVKTKNLKDCVLLDMTIFAFSPIL